MSNYKLSAIALFALFSIGVSACEKHDEAQKKPCEGCVYAMTILTFIIMGSVLGHHYFVKESDKKQPTMYAEDEATDESEDEVHTVTQEEQVERKKLQHEFSGHYCK